MAIIKIKEVVEDILQEIAPDVYGLYFITYRKRVKQLIFQCQNTIYSTNPAILIY